MNINGTLYGTTFQGGSHDEGTVYSVSTSGSERVLHSFGGRLDGAYPLAGLLNVTERCTARRTGVAGPRARLGVEPYTASAQTAPKKYCTLLPAHLMGGTRKQL